MPDNPKLKKIDSRFISLRQRHEVRWWTRRMGVTAERLRWAVKTVGRSVAKVREFMKSDSWTK